MCDARSTEFQKFGSVTGTVILPDLGHPLCAHSFIPSQAIRDEEREKGDEEERKRGRGEKKREGARRSDCVHDLQDDSPGVRVE